MAARALVRRPKVLILDECTASLDRESADRLLEVLSSRSKGVTVLAIAHRLRFVLKSDRILVLSMGKVVACDTPAKLLEQPDSYFSVNLRYEQQEEPSSPTAASG
uniref:ABC transporter domain-containing protein n=1 Tax=Alexandrium andersonii TaxID=327968 RepID=A0A7S2AQI3_9DINO|mmetsp:Transcript_15931/g.35921  ORF Transcript_15931/g.35921 Transcript_15931/m.35921 type:complete len:105 (+) Transcript_15931:3-317(+)